MAGVLAFTQIPLFYQQYLQRLSGHVAELELQLGVLRKTALKSGKTLAEYIQKFLSGTDLDYQAQGHFMQGMVERLDMIKGSFHTLSEAPVWAHPLYLLRYGDAEIAGATLRSFEPGLSFSIESIIYGLLGLAFGIGVYKCLSWMGRRVLRFLGVGNGTAVQTTS